MSPGLVGPWRGCVKRGCRPLANAPDVDDDRRVTTVRPSDDPEFFRRPAPEGRSRESTLRLDSRGRFWHDGALVRHPRLASVLHAWIGRHPDDGRYVLSNGYDWTYVAVDDAPYFVVALRFGPPFDGRDPPPVEPERVELRLSDGSEETWEPTATRVGTDGALYATVKRSASRGPYEAKFTRHAQLSLDRVLVEADGGVVAVRLGGRTTTIGG